MTGRKTREKSSAKAAAKAKFVRLLAIYLAGDSVKKGLALSVGNLWAREWAMIRMATPLSGHLTTGEAEKILKEFLE